MLLLGLLIATVGLTACSDEELDGDMPCGYFQTPGVDYFILDVDENGGEFEMTLHGEVGEEVIPIVYIAPNEFPASIIDSHLYEGYVSRGKLFLPRLQFKADGYSTYPNSLDYTYTFNDMTFSTYKDPKSKLGKIRIKIGPNPGADYRKMIVYLKNQDTAHLAIRQQRGNNSTME